MPKKANMRTQRITFDMLKEATTLTKRSSETPEAHMSRVTHLHLQGKRLEKIEGLELCTNLKVLYLYDNAIGKIENLEFATNLQYLQLQNNDIQEIPAMPYPNLQKLYIDENQIEHLTGLERCIKLEELRIGRQLLSPKQSFQVDPRSLTAFSRTLYSLDISGNGIVDLTPYFALRGLRKLLCGDNRVSNLHDMQDMIGLPYLAEADFRGNPGCAIPKYRDHLISASSDALTLLDEVPVQRHQQIAIKGLMKHRRKIMGMGYIEAQMMAGQGEEKMDMAEFENAESVEVEVPPASAPASAAPLEAGTA